VVDHFVEDKDGIQSQGVDINVVQIGHLFVMHHKLIILPVVMVVMEELEESDKDSVIRVDLVPVMQVIQVILTHVRTQVQRVWEMPEIVVSQEEHGELHHHPEVVPELRLSRRVQVSIKDYRVILSRAVSLMYDIIV